jgi:transcriptional regulator with XRE-family HTH domain
MSRPHPMIERLLEERRALDLSAETAAALAGISRRTLNSLESGTNTGRLQTLDALAHALGFRIELIHVGDKQCRACEEIKPIRHFGRDRTAPDGLCRYCGPCKAAQLNRVAS